MAGVLSPCAEALAPGAGVPDLGAGVSSPGAGVMALGAGISAPSAGVPVLGAGVSALGALSIWTAFVSGVFFHLSSTDPCNVTVRRCLSTLFDD